MTFYLGTHEPGWLFREAFRGVPLFISARRLVRRAFHGAPVTSWSLDSGGFSEIAQHGAWTTTPQQYAVVVRRAMGMGGLVWAAPQDWMCEPSMLQRTGLTVANHQARTIDSYVGLKGMDLPVIPVLQGWLPDDYVRHADEYARRGVTLSHEPVVGLGSVCRRQGMDVAGEILSGLAGHALRLHGFGFKTLGLARFGAGLVSSDSMAWSVDARRAPPLPCHSHRSCANCPEYALVWRARLFTKLGIRQSTD